MLKSDDFRLKNLTASDRWCENCDLSEVEDARHMVLRCPSTRETRDLMFERIDELVQGNLNYERTPYVDRFLILLGSTIEGLNIHRMVDIWLTSAFYIGIIYKQRVRPRKGIG